jgi:hypothetical protein
MRLESKFTATRKGNSVLPADVLEVEITVVVKRTQKDAITYWGPEPHLEQIGRCVDMMTEAFEEEWDTK